MSTDSGAPVNWKKTVCGRISFPPSLRYCRSNTRDPGPRRFLIGEHIETFLEIAAPDNGTRFRKGVACPHQIHPLRDAGDILFRARNDDTGFIEWRDARRRKHRKILRS